MFLKTKQATSCQKEALIYSIFFGARLHRLFLVASCYIGEFVFTGKKQLVGKTAVKTRGFTRMNRVAARAGSISSASSGSFPMACASRTAFRNSRGRFLSSSQCRLSFFRTNFALFCPLFSCFLSPFYPVRAKASH